MTDCIFCKVVNELIPSFRIYEDETFLAFLDISNFAEGHTLLIPKEHFEFIWDMDENLLKEFYAVARKISNHYRNQLDYKYVDSLSMGRQVPHAHLHLIPHNGEENDWNKAKNDIAKLQSDKARRLMQEQGQDLMKKFKIN